LLGFQFLEQTGIQLIGGYFLAHPESRKKMEFFPNSFTQGLSFSGFIRNAYGGELREAAGGVAPETFLQARGRFGR
jgi:hypothetical protein